MVESIQAQVVTVKAEPEPFSPAMVAAASFGQPGEETKAQEGSSDKKDGKDESTKIDPNKMVSLGVLYRYCTPLDWIMIICGAIGSAIVGAAQPAMMILFADIMDLAGAGDPGPELLESFDVVAIKMVGLGAICFVAAWAGEAGFSTSGLRQSAAWRKIYLKSILRQDIGWFDVNKPNELSSRVAELTQSLEEGISSKLNLGIRYAAQGLCGLALAFYYAWDMALVLMALSPLVMFGTWFMTKTTQESATNISNAYAKAGGVASETISELRTVTALGAQQSQATKYEKNLEQAREAGVRKGWRQGLANGLMFSSANYMAGVGFIYGAWKLSKELERTLTDGPVSFGNQPVDYYNCMNSTSAMRDAGLVEECAFSGGYIMIALFALQMGAQGLGLVEPSVTAMAKARAAAWEIIQVVDRKSAQDVFSEEGRKLTTVAGHITFDNVFFSYPSRRETPVCQGYNLVIEPGTTCALVGQSGSGKSTAIQLLERFYDPDSGSVRLDGVDLRDLNVAWLRSRIGLVGQEPVLFSGSIADNIGHGKPGSTREDIEAAAKMANAHDFIMTFPKNFDTDVGEKGGQLSGGQKQRIAIARAMIKNPSVLLLDEATSALDTESERIVQAALDDLLKKHKRTTVVIAHRLSTIRDADKIAVVDKGQIVEQGNHESLMAIGENGFYYKLNHKGLRRGSSSSSSDNLSTSSNDALTELVAKTTEVADVMAEDTTLVKEKSDADIKAEKEQEAKKTKENVKRIWALNENAAPYYGIGTLGALLVGGANPAMGIIFVKCMMNFYASDPVEQRNDSYFWSGFMFMVATLQIFGETWRGWGFGVPGERVTVKLRMMFYNAIMRQEIGWHDLPENTSGALCANLATEVNTIQALTGETLGRNVLTLCTFVCAFTFAFVFGNAFIALVAVACIPIMIGGMAIEIAMMAGDAGGGTQSVGEHAGKIVGEAVTSVRTIASFTLEKKFQDDFTNALDDFLQKAVPKATLKGVFPGLSQISLFCAFALMYWYGGKLISEDNRMDLSVDPDDYCNQRTTCASFETMFIPIFCMFMLGAGLGQAAQGATDTAKAGQAANRVYDVIDRESKIDYTKENGKKPASVQGRIVFDDVHFRYPTRQNQKVANGYNLEIEPGTTVALCGASGSGKSTAIQLIERFYDPEQGSVTLDGTDLRELNIGWLRDQIGLVGQEPVLFMGTIMENIRSGRPSATDVEVIEAAKMANAHDFISGFADKYKTDVGEKGGKLSGGQKQRIAIARAMIKNPSILLLDEATSALDNESERIVQAALDELMRRTRRTTIVIAHRLSTIRNADKICVVDKGRIIEEGTHDQLMARGGKYFTLATSQDSAAH